MYAALDLSKYIVSKCIADGHPISNLQLQKILYYVQKEFLKNDECAFSDDIEAWQFGPVVPNVYYHFCGFGAMPISFSNGSLDFALDPNDKELIDFIVDTKRMLNPWDMVEETHKKNGAWDRIYKEGSGNHHVIPVHLIKEFG